VPNFFQGLGKNLFITICIEKHCTGLLVSAIVKMERQTWIQWSFECFLWNAFFALQIAVFKIDLTKETLKTSLKLHKEW